MTQTHDPSPETKSAHAARSTDLDGAFGDFMSAFEAFRETNDRRLDELERRGSVDAVTADKLERLDRALDETRRGMDDLVLKAARPTLSPDARPVSRLSLDHKAAFSAYIRSGDDLGYRRLEEKSQTVAVGADGGYLVTPELEREITRRMAAVSPIRAIASVRQVSGNVYQKPFTPTGPGAGWVAETAARPETSSTVLQQLSFPTGELYAMPSASSVLLDDAAVDIEAWLADEIELVFAEQEGAAFVSGNGTNKPKGFLAYTNVNNTSWTTGNVGYVPTGVAGLLPASNPSDKLVDFVYTLKAGYRQNANWVMNRKTQAEIRKLKDSTGAYLWQPPAVAGATASLMGFPVVEAEDMPNMATDSFSVALGDFRRGYLVVDRMGVRVLRDPYSAKPYVLFYTTKRVGGGIQDFDAIKLLKFGVS